MLPCKYADDITGCLATDNDVELQEAVTMLMSEYGKFGRTLPQPEQMYHHCIVIQSQEKWDNQIQGISFKIILIVLLKL